MRALVLVLTLAGCNQIFGSSVTGPDDSDDAVDGGVGDGDTLDDGRVPDHDGSTAGCAWTQPAQIASGVSEPSLAVSASGAAHVVYSPSATSMVYMSRAPGQGWSTAAAIFDGEEMTAGSIAVDSANTVHVIYKSYYGNVSYTYRAAGGNWSAATDAASSSYYASYCSLAVGPGGPITGCATYGLYVGQPSSAGQWQIEANGITYVEAHAPGMVVSSTGELFVLVHIGESYMGGYQERIRQLSRTTQGTWQDTEIDYVGYATVDHAYGESTAVAVDGTGTQYTVFTYGNANDRRLRFRRRVPNSLPGPREIPDPSAIVGDVGAVLDAGGNLHVVSQDLVHGNVRYMRRSPSGDWSDAITINAEGAGGSELSLAIDSAGTLHMIFTDPQGHLFYATRCT